MSTADNKGSALTQRTAAGHCSSSGTRSSHVAWSSAETPRWTFGSGHAG
jgi:hypothetical protein